MKVTNIKEETIFLKNGRWDSYAVPPRSKVPFVEFSDNLARYLLGKYGRANRYRMDDGGLRAYDDPKAGFEKGMDMRVKAAALPNEDWPRQMLVDEAKKTGYDFDDKKASKKELLEVITKSRASAKSDAA